MKMDGVVFSFEHNKTRYQLDYSSPVEPGRPGTYVVYQAVATFQHTPYEEFADRYDFQDELEAMALKAIDARQA
ncbi:hypothetical protein HII36_05560 [Nonomuraea sp. NN258]|uniref:hypothetical protein n=1 Tax=Nonomuraea antri TaxID=2730852 RepID=UPI0015689442|nr:hypothetical protein [Nonomuraea antri]NRQ31305.1 hypothetical protein [Nonomuraea antri]